MITAISAIVVFGFLVLIHEWGHFITAKMTGMRVDEFAIGFGPRIFKYKKGETIYSLRCIPLGGFNDIAGMSKEADEESEYGPAGERAYYRRPVLHRMLVIIAGSMMNLLTPILLFWGLLVFNGMYMPSPEPVIGHVVADMPAAKAGLVDGDRIITIDGRRIEEWAQIGEALKEQPDAVHDITYARDGVENQVSMQAELNDEGRWIIGIFSSMDVYYPGALEAIPLAVERNLQIIKMMLESLAGMITGQVSGGDVSGPVGVLQMTGKAAEQGIVSLVSFAAMLSLNLGIINLLPIPVLDGGHFVALCVEGLRGKPLSPRIMHGAQYVGLAILVSIMIYATINDITR